MGRAAATADSASPAMEQAATNAALLGDRHHPLLRLIEPEGRGHDAPILTGIGVAQHNFLRLTRGFQELEIDRLVKEIHEDLFDAVEIVDGLKQRAHADVAEPAPTNAAAETALDGKEQDFKDMAGAMGHRDDVFAEAIPPDLPAHDRHGLEDFEGIAGFRKE